MPALEPARSNNETTLSRVMAVDFMSLHRDRNDQKRPKAMKFPTLCLGIKNYEQADNEVCMCKSEYF